jgi:succinyl-CoA synthetase alpha subunit
LWYQDNPEIKMIVILGEVGNEDENKVADLITSGRITKPVIAWVVGTAAESFKTEVQFGHAGAKANAHRETASFKNAYLRQA